MKKLLLILFCAGLVGCAGNQKILGENNSVPIEEVNPRPFVDAPAESPHWWVLMIWFVLIVGSAMIAWREFKPSPPEQTNDS